MSGVLCWSQGLPTQGLQNLATKMCFGEIYKITLKTKCLNTIHENIHGREVLRSSFICKRLKWMQNVFFGQELMFSAQICPNIPILHIRHNLAEIFCALFPSPDLFFPPLFLTAFRFPYLRCMADIRSGWPAFNMQSSTSVKLYLRIAQNLGDQKIIKRTSPRQWTTVGKLLRSTRTRVN